MEQNKPTTAVRNGISIEINTFNHEDWTSSYEVRIEMADPRPSDRPMFVPFIKTLDEARSAANSVWRAAGREYVQDAYGNPALVTGRNGGTVRITQLVGSDHGHQTSVSREVPVPVTPWMARTAAEFV